MNAVTGTKVALLVTDDSAVEASVREHAHEVAQKVECVRDCREAMGAMLDGCGSEAVAIVDLEVKPSGRRLVETASGTVPVIAITTKANSWLDSMVRRHRVAATLVKPFTSGQLRDALHRVSALRTHEGRAWL